VIKPTNVKDPKFLEMCEKLNDLVNAAVPGRDKSHAIFKKYSKQVGYVAFYMCGEEVAGMVGLAEYKDEIGLRVLYVKPQYCGQGIGEKLCRHVEAVAKQMGFKEIMLESWVQLESAMRLYEKLGYEHFKVPTSASELEKKWGVFMKKELK